MLHGVFRRTHKLPLKSFTPFTSCFGKNRLLVAGELKVGILKRYDGAWVATEDPEVLGVHHDLAPGSMLNLMVVLLKGVMRVEYADQPS
jgi:hypothetical protein